MRSVIALAATWATSVIGSGSLADPPAGFGTELLLEGLERPIALEFLPDGRALLLQWNGRILLLDVDADPPVATPYFDVPQVDNGGSKGAWNLVLDDEFAEQPGVYVFYADVPTDRFRVARFAHLGDTATVDGGLAVWADSDVTILSVNHYGGGLAFGPDGHVYASVGEEGIDEQSQDLTQSGGSLVRVHREGFVPPDNPFVDGPGGHDDTIWAYGFRNPYRASWDIPTGRLLVGDVGQIGWEELNLVVRGGNYGWPLCEGPCDDPRTPDCDCRVHETPFFAYPNTGSVCFVGGHVYRASAFPKEPYYGAYFYGDFMHTEVRYLTFDETETVVTGDFEFDGDAGKVVDLDVDPEGRLYVVNYTAGTLHRYAWDGTNEPPVITSATATPDQGAGPLTVTLSGTADDAEGDTLVYRWRLGDGGVADGEIVEHTYAANGLYRAFLEVSDDEHTTISSRVTVRVGDAPTVDIITPEEGQTFQAGDRIAFEAVAFDPDGGDGSGEELTGDDVQWQIRSLRDGEMASVVASGTGTSGSIVVPSSGPAIDGGDLYRIVVAAFDDDAFSGTDAVDVLPFTVPLTIGTVPPGLIVALDGAVAETPLIIDALVGFQHAVGAADQCADAERFEFVSWSDGGAAFHEIVVPGEASALTATFEAGEPNAGDVDFDGVTGTTDLVQVLIQWGPCPPADLSCPADLDCSGAVDVGDLLLVFLNWT